MKKRAQLDAELVEYIDKVLTVCSSRAAYVINTIFQDGFIDSETIRDEGYVHGARAIGDVRDNGVPLTTLKTKSSGGKSIALYVFGDKEEIKKHKFGGRQQFPPTLKAQLIARDGLVCGLSNMALPETELQIDHRVPYYIAGDIAGARNPAEFMLLSKSMQRSKSWACEHCENITKHLDVTICNRCYWASPGDYSHVAMKDERRLDVSFSGEETKLYDRLRTGAAEAKMTMQDLLKRYLSKFLP